MNDNHLFTLDIKVNRSLFTFDKAVSALLSDIIETYFSDEKNKHAQAIKRLLDFAEKYQSAEEFLSKLALGFNEDVYAHKHKCKSDDIARCKRTGIRACVYRRL